MLSDKSLSQKTTNYRIHLYEMCKIVKDSEAERRLLVAGGCERIRSLMALIARVAPSLNEPIC